MAKYIAYDDAAFDSTATVIKSPKRFSLMAFFDGLSERAHQREAKRTEGRIAQYIENHGGELTDDLERQISREFGQQAGNWR